MGKTIKVSLNSASVDAAIRQLEAYQRDLERKAKEICRRLADIGLLNASASFFSEFYVGTPDVSISVEERGNGYAIIADGETVLILEFGAGVTYGYGHPQAGEFGMGPGTYPDGKGHWNDPRGWWLPKEKGGQHTYGNPPTMAMYNTGQDLRKEIERVAREVFAT